jgi:hypothetical protein
MMKTLGSLSGVKAFAIMEARLRRGRWSTSGGAASAASAAERDTSGPFGEILRRAAGNVTAAMARR